MFKTKRNQNNEVLIAEIHDTFNSAGEKLYAQAMDILEKSGITQIEDKVSRLNQVGFTQSSEVKKWNDVLVTKELADLIKHYCMRYPFNKFITEDQVTAICKKYNLVCAPVSRYRGFVPDEKLKLIEGFQINSFDELPKMVTNVKFSYPHSQSTEIRILQREFPNGAFEVSDRFFDSSAPNIRGVFVSRYKVVDAGLQICAPAKDMDLKGLQKSGSFFKSFTTVHVPDPVVLHPVKGGYLIIAAWGEEASDPIVVNPVNN